MSNLPKLDELEDRLSTRLAEHTVLREIDKLTPNDFLRVLMQRRFVSLAFTIVNDLALDAFRDRKCKTIVRRILREEYPDPEGKVPSHREDLFSDLISLGARKQHIIDSKPTDVTRDVISLSMGLVTNIKLGALSDIRLLTALRFWGEVLTAVEYSAFWRRMSPIFSGKKSSNFYYPHLIEDGKLEPLHKSSSFRETHSDRMGRRLKSMITGRGAQIAFAQTEEDVIKIKLKFYDQFNSLIR
jgi:hypothetical protein